MYIYIHNQPNFLNYMPSNTSHTVFLNVFLKPIKKIKYCTKNFEGKKFTT